jgi:glutaredoxin
MIEIKILSKPSCHLCDAAKFVVDKVARRFDARVVEVDISTDPRLEAAYGCDIPVIFVNGQEHARHRVNERALREWLASIHGKGVRKIIESQENHPDTFLSANRFDQLP